MSRNEIERMMIAAIEQKNELKEFCGDLLIKIYGDKIGKYIIAENIEHFEEMQEQGYGIGLYCIDCSIQKEIADRKKRIQEYRANGEEVPEYLMAWFKDDKGVC